MNVYLTIGFICSLITFVATIILKNFYNIIELNPVMNIFLSNTFYAVLIYGIIWAVTFTAYKQNKDNIYGDYISYLVCFMFGFNLIHDGISLIGSDLI